LLKKFFFLGVCAIISRGMVSGGFALIGKSGENPARSRHCNRGASCQSHWRKSGRGNKRRSGSQETCL